MSYPVGTICIGQKFIVSTELNGMQCVIVEPATMCSLTGPIEDVRDYAYGVRWANGQYSYQRHKFLKRKDWYDEDKRAEDRQKVSKLIAACLSAIEAGEKV